MPTVSSMTKDDRIRSVTSFDYMYRDAGNFKSYGFILLLGRFSKSDASQITETMESGEFFIAEQIGIPPLYDTLFRLSDGMIASDHTWHSFIAMRHIKCSTMIGPFWGTVEDLVRAFVSVSVWDDTFSPNFSIMI